MEDGLIPGRYYDGPNQMESAKMASVPTMKQRLDMAVKQAEERLAAAKRAREIFDRNPDLEELLNLLQRNSF